MFYYLISTGQIAGPTGSGGSGPTGSGGSGPTGSGGSGPTGYFDSSLVRTNILPYTGYSPGIEGTYSVVNPYFPNSGSIKLGGVDLGSPLQPFANLWAGDLQISSGTIFLGGVPISSNTTTNTLILPTTTINGIDPGTLILKGSISALDNTDAINQLNIADPIGTIGDSYIVSSTGSTGTYYPSSHIFARSETGPSGWVDCGVIQGPVGAQGETGSQGSQGIQGSTGPQGVQGETGSQGSQGIQGSTGPQGVQGETGPQ